MQLDLEVLTVFQKWSPLCVVGSIPIKNFGKMPIVFVAQLARAIVSAGSNPAPERDGEMVDALHF